MSVLEAWRSEQLHRAHDQLTAAIAMSAGVVCHAIEKGDAGLAWKLLERLGAMAPPTAEALDRNAEGRGFLRRMLTRRLAQDAEQ